MIFNILSIVGIAVCFYGIYVFRDLDNIVDELRIDDKAKCEFMIKVYKNELKKIEKEENKNGKN